MKILKLEILNLASLDKQGGEVINFEEGVLGDTSIFSIVGPTGSGKSTILDAICLALYNRAPRYPRKKNDRNHGIEIYGTPDESEKNRLAPTDGRNILTRGKKEGYSKLTFLANNGNVYRAEWHVRFFQKNYALPVTLLYMLHATDQGMEETACEWDELPRIIGLDYDQFLRTVLIAQGSFANFLTAKENERYELLEKLIGCEDTYIRIAKDIKEKRDEAQARYNTINASVEAFKQNVLTNEALATLVEEIKQLEANESKRTERLKAVEADLKWYADDEQMMQTIDTLKQKEEEARGNLESIKESVAKLLLHDAILPAMDILRESKRLAKAIEDADIAIESINQSVEKKKGDIEEENKQKTNLSEKVSEAQKTIDNAAPHIHKARELRTLIAPAKTTLTEKEKALATAKDEKKSADQAVAKNKKNIQNAEQSKAKAEQEQKQLNDAIATKKQELLEAEAAAINNLEAEKAKNEGKSADDLQRAKDKAVDDLADLNTAIEVVGRINTLNADLKANEKRQKSLARDNENIRTKLNSLNINQLATEVEGLQKAYTLITSELWHLHRLDLEDGKACPLCGSTHHPYTADSAQVDDAASSVKASLVEKKSLLDAQRKKEKELMGILRKNEGEQKGLETSTQKTNDELRQADEKWTAISSRHTEWKKDKDVLSAMLDTYQRVKAESEQALTAFNNIQNEILRLTAVKDKATSARAKYDGDSAKMQEKANNAIAEANATLAGHVAQTEQLAAQQSEKAAALDRATSDHRSANEVVKNLQEQYNAELGGKDPDAEEKRLADAKKAADEALRLKTEDIAKQNAALGELNGALTAKRQQKDKDAIQQNVQRDELAEWIANYNAKTASALTTDVVDAMLSATDDWEAMRQDKESKERELNSASTLRRDAKAKHTVHQQTRPTLTSEQLTAERDALTNGSQQQQLVDAQAKLKNHNDAVRQMGDRADELAQATLDNDDWHAITEAIGGDGKTLRKIAQCYTLRFLIEHANDEIRKFSGRYELQQVKNSLGIRVIDHDRADDVRDTTSLSGGETFIVSLGLALGLSSLSSRNISFENLFIDEGFGTLDPEALATVIESLSMLQTSQGKKVGVISHTDTMSERITTQIRIIKNGNSGSSHIEIYP